VSDFLHVRVGEEHYLLGMAYVREVVDHDEAAPLPGAGPHVLGILNVRGAVLPLVGVDGLVGVRAAEWRRVVVVEDGERRAGLAVTQAVAVAGLAEPPAAGALVTVAELDDGRRVGVVDVPELLDAVERSVT
jgi:purine-binding chemotaxis protein CheW